MSTKTITVTSEPIRIAPSGVRTQVTNLGRAKITLREGTVPIPRGVVAPGETYVTETSRAALYAVSGRPSDLSVTRVK